MKYIISYSNPNQHYIDIEFIISDNASEKLIVHLPIWRPGRYEEGNFAKNIRTWKVEDKKGSPLKNKKIENSSWEIEAGKNKEVHIKYSYYCGKLDAGSCWLDENQLYINPVHCLLFVDGCEHKPVSVQLIIPQNYKIACALKLEKGNILKAPDYHTMVDSPFIASADLKHDFYISNGIKYHIWFQGECVIDWDKIKNDFKIFTDYQIALFGDFPVKEYHFLFQMLPQRFHHGVEHQASTVIALGQGYKLMNEMYDEFLGISSHELFHTWNVKKIRPKEMLPYNYSAKNYSTQGWVYEGITTYYGNLILLRCGLFDDKKYFRALNEYLEKHLNSEGHFNQSVADASFDTWLDGYVDGVPHRKSNIYTEGSILSMYLDFTIRMFTKNKKSLDDVMRALYKDFGKKNIGYIQNDIQSIIENITGKDYQDFFDYNIKGTNLTLLDIELSMNVVGVEILKQESPDIYENYLGFRVSNANNKVIVKIIAPDSPAEKTGLSLDDEIIAVNDWKIDNNFDDLCRIYYKNGLNLTISSQNILKNIQIRENNLRFYHKYTAKPKNKMSEAQKVAFEKWSKS
jgi:predicted metalloprotease with PDZ domain